MNTTDLMIYDGLSSPRTAKDIVPKTIDGCKRELEGCKEVEVEDTPPSVFISINAPEITKKTSLNEIIEKNKKWLILVAVGLTGILIVSMLPKKEKKA